MTNLSNFQSLWSDMDSTLKEWITEAKELRASVSSPEPGEQVDDVHNNLIAARRAQDRLETLLADAGQVRARLRKLVRELEENYDDKWRDNMLANKVGEYTSGKSQDATYQAGALDELVNARRGKRMLADAEEAYDVIALHYYGLNNVRKDNDAFIRAISLQSQLER